jgi:hypothetical protein
MLLLFLGLQAVAQESTPAPVVKRRFAVYVGAGPNYFFNNVVTGKNLVNEWNYAVVAKVMWEPEHFLSLGLESGYNRLYTANSSGTVNAHIVNSAIPIHISMALKLVKAFYFDLSLGTSLLQSKVDTDVYGNFDGSSISLADFSGALEYRLPTRGRFQFSFGPKFFYSSHTNDKTLALLFLVGYKL